MEEPTDERIWRPWVDPVTSCHWPRAPLRCSFIQRHYSKPRPMRQSLRERRLVAGKRIISDREIVLMLAVLAEGPRMELPTWSGK